jgi:hypothetical protein
LKVFTWRGKDFEDFRRRFQTPSFVNHTGWNPISTALPYDPFLFSDNEFDGSLEDGAHLLVGVSVFGYFRVRLKMKKCHGHLLTGNDPYLNTLSRLLRLHIFEKIISHF